MRRLILIVALGVWSAAYAYAQPVFEFQSPAEEQRFRHLTSELRCLVCQNQSLADSHADLAGDLRREIFERLRAGKSDQEIIDFAVRRYGEFVLYRPPVNTFTLGLWWGPLALLLLGAILLWRAVRRRQTEPSERPDADQLRQAERMLQGQDPIENDKTESSP